jgi:SpoVK/Ycf46/Vps4 family AAA+-type ATPase
VLNKLQESAWKRCFQINEKKTETTIAKIFTEAYAYQPSLVVIDDLEALASPKSESGGMISTLARELHKVSGSKVQVVASASRPIDIDSKVLNYFKEVIELPIPTSQSRLELLKGLAPHTSLEVLKNVADRTHAFTANDVLNLRIKAFKSSLKRRNSTVNGVIGALSLDVRQPSIILEFRLLTRLDRTSDRT